MTYPVCCAASVLQEGRLRLPYSAAQEAFPLFFPLFNCFHPFPSTGQPTLRVSAQTVRGQWGWAMALRNPKRLFYRVLSVL